MVKTTIEPTFKDSGATPTIAILRTSPHFVSSRFKSLLIQVPILAPTCPFEVTSALSLLPVNVVHSR